MGAPQQTTESVGEAIDDTTRRLLPWAVSILMHVGLVILAVFVVWSTMAPPQPEDAPVISGLVQPRPFTAPDVAPRADMRERQDRGRRVDPRKSEPLTRLRQRPAPGRDMSVVSPPMLGDSFRVESVSEQPGGIFATPPVQARRIAFVIDASGSLIDTLPFVIRELQETVLRLSDNQQFTVIFFQGGPDGRSRVIEFPGGMQAATGTAKQRLIDWIDPAAGHVIPGGRTNPVEALKLAMTRDAQLIYLLSDNITGRGAYELSQVMLLSDIRRMNRRAARINTIQFVYPDPLASVPGMRGTLELIAEETGGQYQFVSARDLFW